MVTISRPLRNKVSGRSTGTAVSIGWPSWSMPATRSVSRGSAGLGRTTNSSMPRLSSSGRPDARHGRIQAGRRRPSRAGRPQVGSRDKFELTGLGRAVDMIGHHDSSSISAPHARSTRRRRGWPSARSRRPAPAATRCPEATPISPGRGRNCVPEGLYLCFDPRFGGLCDVIDPFGRKISYLRVSVTDRCDFRCVYCMAEDMTFLPKAEVLSLEELDRLCSAFVRLGVRKLRLTGGEPLVRRNIMTLFRGLGRHLETGALDELTVTTNGSQLAKYANELQACGVRRVNVSIDTLDPAKFAAITRWGKLEPVLDGVFAAKAAGLQVKVNAVALKGVNDDEFDRMLAWCGEHGFDMKIIEGMPMGDSGPQRVDQYLPVSLVRA